MLAFETLLVPLLWGLVGLLAVISVMLAVAIWRGVAAYRRGDLRPVRKDGPRRLIQAGLAVTAMYVWVRGGRETIAAIDLQVAGALSLALTVTAALALLHAIYADRGVR